KGRVYYRCQVPSCPTTTVREDSAENHLLSLLKPLQFSAEHQEEFRAAVAEFRQSDHAEQQQRNQARRLRLANVGERLNRLTDAYLEGAIDKVDFGQRKAALLVERRSCEDQVSKGDEGPDAADTLTE